MLPLRNSSFSPQNNLDDRSCTRCRPFLAAVVEIFHFFLVTLNFPDSSGSFALGIPPIHLLSLASSLFSVQLASWLSTSLQPSNSGSLLARRLFNSWNLNILFHKLKYYHRFAGQNVLPYNTFCRFLLPTQAPSGLQKFQYQGECFYHLLPSPFCRNCPHPTIIAIYMLTFLLGHV